MTTDSRLLMNARPAGMSLPPWIADDPEAAVARVLHGAHGELPGHVLAEVLLAVRAALVPLHAGRPTPRPTPGATGPPGPWSAAALTRLRAVRAALYLAARADGPEAGERLADLAARIERQVDEVASRPRGVGARR